MFMVTVNDVRAPEFGVVMVDMPILNPSRGAKLLTFVLQLLNVRVEALIAGRSRGQYIYRV
jgi:hypothetical protein